MKVINELTNRVVTRSDLYKRGIVYVIDKDNVEFGYFPFSPDIVYVETQCGTMAAINYDVIKDFCVFNRRTGKYSFNKEDSFLCYGYGDFPYSIKREYAANKNIALFADKQEYDTSYKYKLSNDVKFTFGLEFETSMGYVPQIELIKKGLIPLRDGSISGIEYTTVVMNNDGKGLNLLKEQLDLLKEYTLFNKECALHIHFGGYPITPKHLFSLYKVFSASSTFIANHANEAVFNTSMYKANKKDYCMMLPPFSTFDELYEFLSDGKKFDGDLYAPHPDDIEGERKWQIHTRYYALNLINAMFYNKSKTIEFRFLRPSYNFNYIYTWIAILNYLLSKSIEIADSVDTLDELEQLFSNNRKSGSYSFLSIPLDPIGIRPSRLEVDVVDNMSIVKYGIRERGIIDFYSDDDIKAKLSRFLPLLHEVKLCQVANRDICGQRTDILDAFLTD